MYNTNIYDGYDKMEIVMDCINKSIRRYANGIITFDDATKTIFVDTTSGTVGVLLDNGNKIKYFARGFESVKNDGYVYAVISYHHIDGTIHNDPVGQHRIVAMVSDMAGYLAIPTRPEACHINGIRWDNRSSNIEWGTHSKNARQGKIVASLEHHFPGVYTYKIIKAGHEFNCVPLGIMNEWIDDYINTMCSGKNVFKLKRNVEYIDDNIVSDFVDWLYNMNYWV